MSNWDWFERDLAGKLGALSDGEFVVIELPASANQDGAEPPKKSWFRRAAPDPRPYVQFMRNQTELIAEVSHREAGEPTKQAIIALGWSPPVRNRAGNFEHSFSSEDSELYLPEYGAQAARLAVATLIGPLGVGSPDDLTTQVDH